VAASKEPQIYYKANDPINNRHTAPANGSNGAALRRRNSPIKDTENLLPP
jgi:hypothetical protein